MADDQRIERRGVFRWIAGLVSTGIAAVVVVPALRLIGHPLGRRVVYGGEEPVAVAELAKLPEGVPVRVDLRAPSRFDAWSRRDDVALGAVWLVRTGESVRAFSSLCPHAGCFVDWEGSSSAFRCPCHGSDFSLEGVVRAGPSPRALDALPVSVKDGKVLVSWRRFRPASARAEEV